MRRVEPIREEKCISRMKEVMKKEKKYRDLLLFVIRINTPLHMKEILPMKWKVFLKVDGTLKKSGERVEINDERKKIRFIISPSIEEALFLHFTHYPLVEPESYIFVSRKAKEGNYYPITRQYVWRLLNAYARKVGFKEKIGAHTLRKTFAYHLWKKGVPLSLIRKLLNQSTIEETLHYIGIDKKNNNYCEEGEIPILNL